MYREHNPIVPIPAVNAAIFNEKRQILLTRRSPVVREPGKWCLPGGHLDGGEPWATALVREVKEEVGLTVLEHKLVGIYSDPTLTVTEQAFYEGKRGQFVVAFFLVSRYEGEVTPNEEVDQWEWFESGRLPSPILKSHPIRVEDAFRFRGEPFVR